MNPNRESLKTAGFIEVSPGNWRKPSKPRPVAGLQNTVAQPNLVSADEGSLRDEARGKRSVAKGNKPMVKITITSLRKRALDGDNLQGGGAKFLRDAIAASLNLDDADSVIEWKYQQLVTQGPLGTLVQLETP